MSRDDSHSAATAAGEPGDASQAILNPPSTPPAEEWQADWVGTLPELERLSR